jgi:hypothetical protein
VRTLPRASARRSEGRAEKSSIYAIPPWRAPGCCSSEAFIAGVKLPAKCRSVNPLQIGILRPTCRLNRRKLVCAAHPAALTMERSHADTDAPTPPTRPAYCSTPPVSAAPLLQLNEALSTSSGIYQNLTGVPFGIGLNSRT